VLTHGSLVVLRLPKTSSIPRVKSPDSSSMRKELHAYAYIFVQLSEKGASSTLCHVLRTSYSLDQG